MDNEGGTGAKVQSAGAKAVAPAPVKAAVRPPPKGRGKPVAKAAVRPPPKGRGKPSAKGQTRQHKYADGTVKGHFPGSIGDKEPLSSVQFKENIKEKPGPPEKFIRQEAPKMVKADMKDDLLEFVVSTTEACIDRYKDDIDISRCVKMKLENHFQGCWVVVVGSNYATFISEDAFQMGTFAYFFVGRKGYLIFKCF
jgi:hypothetical protein